MNCCDALRGYMARGQIFQSWKEWIDNPFVTENIYYSSHKYMWLEYLKSINPYTAGSFCNKP